MTNTLEATGDRIRTSSRRTPKFGFRTRAFADTSASSAFLLPIVAVFVVLFAIPLVQTVYYSFTDFNGLSTDIKFVGFANYVTTFTDPSLLTGLGFTILYAVATTVLITAIAIPLAVVFNKRFLGRTLARSIFFFVGVPSMVILGLIWQYIFSPLNSGAINTVLVKLGFSAVPWLADPTLARWCVIFVAVWAHIGWHATLYLAYLQAIPKDLYEQADIDGANGRQQFFNITLPELVPALVVSSFLLITGGLKVYDLPFAMTHGGPGFATTTITQSIISKGLGDSDYGVGSALAVLFTLASMAIIIGQLSAANALSRRYS
jgi:raffinose/stachyose/melibiose transport system permease protein